MDIRSQLLAARLMSAALLVLGLVLAKPVLFPLGLAVLVAFMLQPAVRWLRRYRVPNVAAVALTTVMFFSLLGLLGWVIAGQVRSLSAEIPKYGGNIADKITQIRGQLRGGSIDTLKSTMTEVMETVEAKERESAGSADEGGGVPAAGEAGGVAQAAPLEEPEPAKVVLTEDAGPMDELNQAAGLLSPLGTAGLVVLLVVLLLLKWADLRVRLIALIDHNLSTTTAALDDAAQRVSRYLATQFMVNAGVGLLVWAGLSLIGLPYAGLMGLCAGLFRYVPYIGPLAAAALPLALSVATEAGWAPVIAVAVLFSVLEILLNNVIEPWLYGSRLGVSELGIILATMVWTLIWGPAGLVLATPLTVCLVVLGEKVPGLAFISKILSDRVHLPVHATLTQRLMAGDTLEATEIVADFQEKSGAEETYDTVVVPALARVRQEQRLGHLDDVSATAIAASLPPMLEAPVSDGPPSGVEMTKDSTVAIWSLCPMTEAAASMLVGRLRHLPCRLELFTTQHLASDVVARLTAQPPLGIVVLHLDPSDYPRVAATVQRLRRGLSDLPLVVGRWGDEPLAPGEREELGSMGVSSFVDSPADLAAWISPRALDVAQIVPEAGPAVSS